MLTNWTPFGTISTIEREMQDMMDRFFGSSRLSERGETTAWVWRPRVDIFRDDKDLVVQAELPGIDPEHDLDITVEGNMLHLKGQRSFDHEIEEGGLYVRERAYGTFQRDVLLPEGIDTDKLDATYENGVLTVRMPLPESLQQKQKKLEVKVGKAKKLGRTTKAA